MRKFPKLLILLSVFLFLLLSPTFSMSQSDILENLLISRQLLSVAEIQLLNLESELNNKNLLLNQLQLDNQNLKMSLGDLQTNFKEQSSLLTEQQSLSITLSESNKTLMDTQVRLEEQLTKSLEQLTSLSKASERKVSLTKWVSLSIGAIVGAGIACLIMQVVR